MPQVAVGLACAASVAAARVAAQLPGPPAGRAPIFAVTAPSTVPATGIAGLAACRRQRLGERVPAALRLEGTTVCADAGDEDVVGVAAATLAGCPIVAREAGNLERRGSMCSRASSPRSSGDLRHVAGAARDRSS